MATLGQCEQVIGELTNIEREKSLRDTVLEHIEGPEPTLGWFPFSPRAGFMVWVKTIKNTLVFSLVSVWVSLSSNKMKSHAAWQLSSEPPTWVRATWWSPCRRTETRGRHEARQTDVCFPSLSAFLWILPFDFDVNLPSQSYNMQSSVWISMMLWEAHLYCSTYQDFTPFYCQVIFYCRGVQYFIYLSTY